MKLALVYRLRIRVPPATALQLHPRKLADAKECVTGILSLPSSGWDTEAEEEEEDVSGGQQRRNLRAVQ
jgi:hypothetical protein